MTSARFPFLQVDAAGARADELGALLFELGAEGVEVRDETTLDRGPGQGRVRLVATFADVGEAERARQWLSRHEPDLTCVVDELHGDEWRDKYKEHFTPFALTASVTVAPPWDVPEVVEGTRLLVLDPGRAFGTGLHATTSLVAGELDERRAVFAGESILDVGTGSGILALMALQLGASAAVGIDTDPEAIAVAAENAARNGMDEAVTLRCQVVGEVTGRYAVVIANIETRVLVTLANELIDRTRPGGLLLLSGVLAEERDELAGVYEAAAKRRGVTLDHQRTVRRGDGPEGWVALSFVRRVES
ncbi:MAG: 50S ribosomal protein L11 methyltransferase [Deltaproteobacteria bacterium]|nr:50S ribosomal protein L11 methyltransferase [Deltaproteobacteria bacterium]